MGREMDYWSEEFIGAAKGMLPTIFSFNPLTIRLQWVVVAVMSVSLIACVDPAVEDGGGETVSPSDAISPQSSEDAQRDAAPSDGDPKKQGAVKQTILEIVGAGEQFSTFVSLVGDADLGREWRRRGPYTLFAPTNEAFAALPEGTVEQLRLAANREALQELLRYHVARGKVWSAETVGEVTSVNTLAGVPLQIDGTTNVIVVSDAVVTLSDIKASNGVVHVVDTVLLPPLPSTEDE